MEYVILGILIVFICSVIIVNRKPQKRRHQRFDARGFDHNHIHKNGTKYDDSGFDYLGHDSEGYRVHGYNDLGKNRKGQYNRLYDTMSCVEDGFWDPVRYPISFSAHSRERFAERLGVTDYHSMQKMLMDAYCYGKSKRQIKKTSAYLVGEIENKNENGVVLIYKNYIYIFSHDNVLITVYKNDRIPL